MIICPIEVRQKERVKRFLSSIDDKTGTIRRYAKSLEHRQELWQVKEVTDETNKYCYAPRSYSE